MQKKLTSIVLNNFLYDSRVLQECLSLQKAGYDVDVVAMHEGDLPEWETIEGLPVHRIRLKSRNWSKNRFVQLFKYVELFYRFLKHHRKSDLYHCNDITPLPMGILVKTFFNRRAKVIYDAHELEFDRDEDGAKFLQKLFKIAERLCINRADAMLTVSPLIAKAYQEEYGIEPPPYVLNCPPYRAPFQANIFREKFNIRADQHIFLYQGGFTPGRGIETIIEAFKEIDEQYVVVILGHGHTNLEIKVKQAAQDFPNIYYHPAVSHFDLHRYTASADFGFVLYQGKSRNHNLTIGNKIFQYVMAGLPVLASPLEGIQQVFRWHSGIGFLLENAKDVEGLRAEVRRLGGLGKAHFEPALRAAAADFNWEKSEVELLKVYVAL